MKNNAKLGLAGIFALAVIAIACGVVTEPKMVEVELLGRTVKMPAKRCQRIAYFADKLTDHQYDNGSISTWTYIEHKFNCKKYMMTCSDTDAIMTSMTR